MKPWISAAMVGLFLLNGGTPGAFSQSEKRTRTLDIPREDPIALGAPLSYWLNVIHSRNTRELDQAYHAIIQLGPYAWAAVPELTQIVAEPFVPIRMGRDDKGEINSKVQTIFIKGGAVDSLGAIGAAAAPAARSVIEWALTVRVLAPEAPTSDPLFIDLVALDALERMRGAETIAQIGMEALPEIRDLMESGNSEKRKFAVAILKEASLPIASDLMKSDRCSDRVLGLSALMDMWPVVASQHVDALAGMLACSEDMTKKAPGRQPGLD